MTLSLKANDLPPQLQTFANFLINFFNELWAYIPQIPDFDYRIRVIAFSVGIPTILYVLFTWISGSFIKNILQVLNISAVFCLFLSIGSFYFSGWTFELYNLIIFIVSILYLIISIFVYTIHSHCLCFKKTESLTNIIYQIVDFYMQGVIPGVKSDLTNEKIDTILHKYSSDAVIEPVTPSAGKSIFLIILILGFVALFLFGYGIISPSTNLDPFYSIFIMVISAIVFVILTFILIMISFKCLSEAFVSVRKFIRRYGLKAILLLLDLLYIPICTAFLDIFQLKKIGCDKGQYLSFTNITNNVMGHLVNANGTCTLCSQIYTIGECANQCNGMTSLRLITSNQIDFSFGIVKVFSPMIFFVFIFFVIGEPLLWCYMIIVNKKIAWCIPMFGKTLDEKWNRITTLMSSPGFFLFYAYKYNRIGWGIFIPVFKLVILLLTFITNQVYRPLAFGIFIVHFLCTILYITLRPFSTFCNNLLNIILSISNSLLALLPILMYFDIKLPNEVSIPFSVLIVLIPIVSLFCLLCCRTEALDLPMSPLEEDKENKEEDKVINLDYTYIASISQILDISGLKKIGSDEDNGQNELESFNYDGLDVSRSLVVDRIRGACETIDQICDAVTTKMVLTILRVCIVASMACAGWFFGGIISQAKFEPLYC